MKHAVSALFVVMAAGWVVAVAVGLTPFSWLETVAVVTGAACVLLTVRRSIWNFSVGIVSSAAYMMFFAEGRLYADAGLQVLFIGLGIHGWVVWAQGRTNSTPILRLPLGELTVLAVSFPAAWLALTRLLELVNGAAPVYDAFVTTLSVVAQWLLNRRYVETWLCWIVVDQVSVVLFWSRGMYPTAVLYALFLVMCVAGFIEWRRTLGEGRE